jgi:putative membrane protein
MWLSWLCSPELSVVRRIPLLLGIATLALAWLSPLASAASHALYAHMTVHMSVVPIAAPLLAIAVAGGAWDSRSKNSVPSANGVAAGTCRCVGLAHTGPLSGGSESHYGVAEQTTFLFSGFILWISKFGGDSAALANHSGSGVVALLLTAMHMTLLGALLALSPRPLYARPHGSETLSPLDDQHLGGATMLIVGGVSYLAGGLWLSAGLLLRGYLKAAAPASATVWSCLPDPPLTPRPPTTLPPRFKGIPPAKMMTRPRFDV